MYLKYKIYVKLLVLLAAVISIIYVLYSKQFIYIENMGEPISIFNSNTEYLNKYTGNSEKIHSIVTKEEFEEQRRGRSLKIVFKRDEVIDKISETYSDVHQSEKLALFNSANYLEIAINKGNAAGLFGLEGYAEKQNMQTQYMQNRLLYQTVKIFFD